MLYETITGQYSKAIYRRIFRNKTHNSNPWKFRQIEVTSHLVNKRNLAGLIYEIIPIMKSFFSQIFDGAPAQLSTVGKLKLHRWSSSDDVSVSSFEWRKGIKSCIMECNKICKWTRQITSTCVFEKIMKAQ